MAKCGLSLTVGLRWWVRLYLQALVLFCMVFGTVPNAEKVLRVVMRGLYVRPE